MPFILYKVELRCEFFNRLVGSTVGDQHENVLANRALMRDTFGIEPDTIRTAWQVHGANVLVANDKLSLSEPPPRADAIITDSPHLALTMRFADCVPMIFHDPRRGVIGMAHAGWRGTVANVGVATVQAMQQTYECKPADIVVGIGPSICAEHYAVGEEVVAAIEATFDDIDGLVESSDDGSTRLDLWAANHRALLEAGVGEIEVAGICTAGNTDEFFSHRAEKGQTGRFGAIVTLSS